MKGCLNQESTLDVKRPSRAEGFIPVTSPPATAPTRQGVCRRALPRGMPTLRSCVRVSVGLRVPVLPWDGAWVHQESSLLWGEVRAPFNHWSPIELGQLYCLVLPKVMLYCPMIN